MLWMKMSEAENSKPNGTDKIVWSNKTKFIIFLAFKSYPASW